MFALGGQRIEADEHFVDEAGMAHHEPAVRQTIEELLHQRAEIGLSRKIISAGKRRIECDPGGCGALAKLRAQNVEHQRLGRGEPLCKRAEAAGVTFNPAFAGAYDFSKMPDFEKS